MKTVVAAYAVRMAVGLVAALASGSPAFAQAPVILTHNSSHVMFEDEVMKRRKHQVLDETLFGDKINLQDGTMVFEQTDISIPLNAGRQLTFGRQSPQGKSSNGILPSQAALPMMRAVYDARDGWNSGTIDGYRCSKGEFVPRDVQSAANPSGSKVPPYYYWRGIGISIPSHGTQSLLKANASQLLPSDGKIYVGTTKGQWRISCTTALKNATGEGFEVLLPNGTRYTFDWMAQRDVMDMMNLTTAQPSERLIVPLTEYILYATKVTDRFGNTINYEYDAAAPNNIKAIIASEGPRIDITYNGANLATATTNGRTWTYQHTGSLLSSVTLPDGSQYKFEGDAPVDLSWVTFNALSPGCSGTGTNYANSRTFGFGIAAPYSWVVKMTHPSGAVGTFNFGAAIHGTNNTPAYCLITASGGSVISSATNGAVPAAYATSLFQKKIDGSGLTSRDWRYNYRSTWSVVCPGSGCTENTSGTSVLRNDGVLRDYTFGNNYRTNFGLLLSERVSKDGTLVQAKGYGYRLPGASAPTGPYPLDTGTMPVGRPATSPDGLQVYPEVYGNPLDSRHRPLESTTLQVDGALLRRTINAFDVFARPASTTASTNAASGIVSRVETQEYFDHLPSWTLGQSSRSAIDTVETSRTEYSAKAQPLKVYSFGRLVETLSYNPDGTLAAVVAPSGAKTTYSQWRAGLPQRIQYPITPDSAAGATESAVIDANGWITSFIDEMGRKSCFEYDAVGRMSGIVPPNEGNTSTCDTAETTRKKTRINFEYVSTTAEYGIPANHWRRTISQGNLREISYFDAFFQPLVDERFDSTKPAATRSVIARQFNLDGALAYESYPQRSITAYNGSAPGKRFSYDALVRPTGSSADSELGLLQESTTYLPFKKRHTNARGKLTETTYQMFDRLDYERPIAMALPAGVNISISRDSLGFTQSITRSGTGAGVSVSATRRYVYDANRRLCKTIDPETAATIKAYDADSNIAWRASGINALGTSTCDSATVTAASKISFSYDAIGRLLNTTYGDGSAAINRSYFPDGKLRSISSAGSTWNYAYNGIGQVTSESLGFQANTYILGRSYNAMGHLATLSYPQGGPVVALNPNALGQATTMGAYAKNVSYHPNGAIAGYTLGNGIVHSSSQNTRTLPSRLQDAGVLHETYSYDANGNTLGITDNQEAGLTSRSLGYDDLDRLTAASAPRLWGAASYSYDALDNMRTAVVGNRNSSFSYGDNNQLTGMVINGQASSYAFDPRGNLAARGINQYSFDLGNRMLRSSIGGSYLYDGHGRRTFISTPSRNTRTQFYAMVGEHQGQLMWADSQGGGLAASVSSYIYLGKKPIAEVRNNVDLYLHADALGSPVAQTNATGGVLTRTRWEPYGAVAAGTKPGPTSSVIGFTGHVQDAESGLVYMQQRYYEPIAGRFLSVDPVTTDASTGKMFGRYHYGNDNPYKYIDPDGRLPIIAIGIFIAKEVAGEAFEQATGLPAPTVKGLGKAALKTVAKEGGERLVKEGGEKVAKGGTYVLQNADGTVVKTGRSNNLLRREGELGRKHPDKTFEVDKRTDDKAAQRGREQDLHDANPSAHAENGGLDKINGINPNNPKRDEYLKAGRKLL